MSNNYFKYYSLWEVIWKWVFRILSITVSFLSIFHLMENPWGMTSLFILSFSIGCYINYGVIYLYDGAFEWQKRYAFNLFNKKYRYTYSEIIEIKALYDENDENLEFLFGYGVKRSLYIILRNGKKVKLRTYISVADLMSIAKEVVKKQ